MENETDAARGGVPTLDRIYAILGDRRRRAAVAILLDREPPVSLRELASTLASLEVDTENGVETGNATSSTVDEVAKTLHHVHLPALDDANVVEYDAETNTVTSLRTTDLSPFLRPVRGVS